MEYRRLGKSGLQVSALSLGSWLTFGNQVPDDVAESLMVHAYEAGVNFFDNAEGYANGNAERVMGQILRNQKWERSSYVVSSKVFFGDGGTLPNQTGLSRKHLVEACNAALKRLQLDYLDLYFCHRPDPTVPMEEIVWTMTHLIQQGKILYWGTSEWPADQIMEAHLVSARDHLIAPVMEQPQYNLLERKRMEQEYALLFHKYKMGSTIWSPLASGLLTGKYNNGIPPEARIASKDLGWLRDLVMQQDKIDKATAIGKVAQEAGLSMVHLAIAWCLHNPNVSTVILGASRVEQLLENLKALSECPKLTAEVLDKLDLITK